MAAAAVLLFAAFIFALGIWGLAEILAHPPAFSEEEHRQFFLGFLMLFASAFFLVRNTLLTVKFCVEYDEFHLVFQVFGSKEHVFTWWGISHKADFKRVRLWWEVSFQDDAQKFLLSRTMRGFLQFERALRDKGVIP